MRACAARTFTGSFASFHAGFWDWYWAITLKRLRGDDLGDEESVFLAIWGRGAGKSSNVEWAAIVEGAFFGSGYVLYVSGTQALADGHVASIRERIESDRVARDYPHISNPKIGKFGNQYGWSQSVLITGGRPSWTDIDMQACQKFLDDSGREAFLAEYQHDFSLIEEVRVIPEYNEALHVITWSEFAKVYGCRHVPKHWAREVGLDVGFTDEHLSAWTWIATAAENSALPGLQFRYRGLTFTSRSLMRWPRPRSARWRRTPRRFPAFLRRSDTGATWAPLKRMAPILARKKGNPEMVEKQDEKPIERKPVTSSNIVSVGFCPDRKCIDVEFKSGVYRYHDCDRTLFDDLMKAESVGKFVHANLKSKKFRKI